MSVYLSETQLRVLAALADGGWRRSVDLADELDLPSYAPRAALMALRTVRLVERGADLETVGQWRITTSGQRELSQRQQLSMM